MAKVQALMGYLEKGLSSEDKQELLGLMEDYRSELVPQEGVFQHQLRLAAHQVQGCTWDRRVVLRLGPPAEGLCENLTKGTKDLSHEGKE
jgi:hypothetical protein